MTGWRLGTLVANPEISKAVASLQSQTTSNATTFAQFGALAAMEHWEQSMNAVKEMLVHFDRRRLKLLNGLRDISVYLVKGLKVPFIYFRISHPSG